MDTPPLSVSVIVPNYNYAHFFVSRLHEILKQTYPISELIILDDASTDESVKIIQQQIKQLKHSHPNLKTIFRQNSKNSNNVFSQWQQGIKLATSDYIWIAELDDSVLPNFLATAIKPFQTNPQVVLSYTNSKFIGHIVAKDNLRRAKDFFRRRHLPGSYIIDGKQEIVKNLAVYNSIPNVSACVFKNLPELDSILDGAKQFRLSGDWYFYLELLRLGNLAYSPRRLNFHRLSPSSITGQTGYKTRHNELRKIHRHASQILSLPKTTLRRMARSEQYLSKKWHLLPPR